jgi:hypothetical protein
MINRVVFNLRDLRMETVKQKHKQKTKEPKPVQVFKIITGKRFFRGRH